MVHQQCITACDWTRRDASVALAHLHGATATPESAEAVDELANIIEGYAAEVRRIRELFEDAGKGEHNVLALIDHYQGAAFKAEAKHDRMLTGLDKLHGQLLEGIAPLRLLGLSESASAFEQCAESLRELLRGEDSGG